MNRIFISYSHKDASEMAEFLYERLTGCGYQIWKDDHSLKLGSSFPKEISDAVGEQGIFIVLLTSASLASAWVQDEVDMAVVARRKIIPIVLEKLEIPLYLKKIHCLFMPRGKEDWQSLNKLVNDLDGGESIPRVYNMSGHDDIEVEGVLVLAHGKFENVDLTDPKAIEEAAQKMGQSALPFLKAGAGIVPQGHPALACAILAYLLGVVNQMPKLFFTYKYKKDDARFRISGDRFILLQNMRDLGFEYRSQS